MGRFKVLIAVSQTGVKERCNDAMVKLLLDKDAGMNVESKSGQTP
jgi:hypothetical protein